MKKEVISKLKWIFVTLGLIGIAFLIYFFILIFQYLAIPGKVLNEITQQECNGTISSIKENQTFYSTVTIRQEKDSVKFNFPICPSSADIFIFTKIGDKIRKEKGSLRVFITKQTTGETKEFEYPMCYK